MARGYIYEISSNLDMYPVGCMSEGDLYRYQDHEFDWVEDVHNYSKDELRKLFEGHGFQTSLVSDQDTTDEGILCIRITEDAREKYFEGRFRECQHMMAKMTLPEFSKSCYGLQNLMEQQYGDAVYVDSYFYTFDTFMRDVEPDRNYYVGNVCIMH